jgi:hypothetical protein
LTTTAPTFLLALAGLRLLIPYVFALLGLDIGFLEVVGFFAL